MQRFVLISALKWKRLHYKNVFFSTNISSTQKQIWRPFFCAEEIFWKKTNCFKSWGEKRLQKVDLIEYIFLPQNFLRQVMPTKTSRKRMRSRGARKEVLPMVENSHYSIGTLRSSTLLLQYITLIFRWAPFNLKHKFAIFFRTFSIEFSANSKMENIEIKRVNNCEGVLHLSFFLCTQILRYHSEFYFLLLHSILFLEVFVGMNRLKKVWFKICFEFARGGGVYIARGIFLLLALSSQRASIMTPQEYHRKKILKKEKMSQMNI